MNDDLFTLRMALGVSILGVSWGTFLAHLLDALLTFYNLHFLYIFRNNFLGLLWVTHPTPIPMSLQTGIYRPMKII